MEAKQTRTMCLVFIALFLLFTPIAVTLPRVKHDRSRAAENDGQIASALRVRRMSCVASSLQWLMFEYSFYSQIMVNKKRKVAPSLEYEPGVMAWGVQSIIEMCVENQAKHDSNWSTDIGWSTLRLNMFCMCI